MGAVGSVCLDINYNFITINAAGLEMNSLRLADLYNDDLFKSFSFLTNLYPGCSHDLRDLYGTSNKIRFENCLKSDYEL